MKQNDGQFNLEYILTHKKLLISASLLAVLIMCSQILLQQLNFLIGLAFDISLLTVGIVAAIYGVRRQSTTASVVGISLVSGSAFILSGYLVGLFAY